MEAQQAWFAGVDVGGTKIHAALVHPSGRVRKRRRLATPREATRENVLASILQAVREVLDKADLDSERLGGIGLAVPGLIHYPRAMVEAAPNITISGINLEEPLRDAFHCPVELANDTDACAMGEKWVGSARGMDLAVGVFVGTGIGGGVIVHRKLLRGQTYSAAEIGHMVMQIDGPVCGCGNRGCLEALASRTAIERDVRQAISDGRPTLLNELLEDDRGVLRSGMLKKALEADDELTVEIMQRAGHVLAQAMVSLRRLFEPDVMILGGGVMEACGDFLMPIVEREVPADPYLGRRDGGRVVLSALGDDAGVLGAAALAMERAGLDPFDEQTDTGRIDYPEVRLDGQGGVTVGENEFAGDVIVRVNGKARKRKKSDDGRLASVTDLREKDLRRAVKGGPELLIIARPPADDADLHDDLKRYLTRRAIRWELIDRTEADRRFADGTERRALLMLTG